MELFLVAALVVLWFLVKLVAIPFIIVIGLMILAVVLVLGTLAFLWRLVWPKA